jgi:hypothetical protein
LTRERKEGRKKEVQIKLEFSCAQDNKPAKKLENQCAVISEATEGERKFFFENF